MKNNYKPLIVAVFLVIGGLGSRVLIPSNKPNTIEVKGFLGSGGSAIARYSPVLIGIAQAQGAQAMDSAAVLEAVVDQPAAIGPSAPIYTGAAIQDPGQPIGNAIDPSATLQYKVQRGDTLSSVATHFHISAAIILSANPNIRKKRLQVGTNINIPGAVQAVTVDTSSAPKLPNFNADFILPAQGYNYGVLDENNGITIVNSCGTPVVAAADGIVVPDKNIPNTSGGWNGGYGNFVLIEHAFGNDIFTRYTHLEQSSVQIGGYIKQGQEIGLIGQTGGVGACELGFQVIGAQNPFAK